jgi:hypothetical protein
MDPMAWGTDRPFGPRQKKFNLDKVSLFIYHTFYSIYINQETIEVSNEM